MKPQTMFGLLVAMSTTASGQDSCTMVDQPGQTYDNNVLNSDQVETDFASNTFQLCKASCLSKEECMAAVFSFVCFLLPTIETPIEGTGVLALKSCMTDSEPPTCSTTSQMNSDGSDEAISVSLSAMSCKTLCGALTECGAFSFGVASSKCDIFYTVPASTNSPSDSFGTKSDCEDGTDCCFDTMDNTVASSQDADLSYTDSGTSCRELCLQVSTCEAASYGDSVCKIFTSTPSFLPGSSATLYTKSCDDGASKGSATYTDGCNADPEPPTCSLNSQMNSDGSDEAISVSLSAISCQTLCGALTECVAFSFGVASSKCDIFYTVPAATTSASDSFGTKSDCEDGTDCCFNTMDNTVASGRDADLSYTDSGTSCKDLCLQVSTCEAASYGDSVCKVFTSTPSVSTGSSATLYTKSCDVGASKGSATYTEVCNAGSLYQLSALALALPLGYVLLAF